MPLDAHASDALSPVAGGAIRTHIVRVSDMALAQMSLAAMEGFEVPHAVGNGSRRGVEIYAALWGHTIMLSADTALYALEMAAADTSAERTTGSVENRFEALQVKTDMIHSFWPNLRFMGDFHTHPHRNDSIGTITRHKLFRYSDEDYTSIEEEGSRYRELGYRVGVVMTIGRSPRSLPAVRLDDQTIRFSMGKTIFWLQAHVAMPSEDGGLRFIRKPMKEGHRVMLECPGAFGHELPIVKERQKAARRAVGARPS